MRRTSISVPVVSSTREPRSEQLSKDLLVRECLVEYQLPRRTGAFAQGLVTPWTQPQVQDGVGDRRGIPIGDPEARSLQMIERGHDVRDERRATDDHRLKRKLRQSLREGVSGRGDRQMARGDGVDQCLSIEPTRSLYHRLQTALADPSAKFLQVWTVPGDRPPELTGMGDLQSSCRLDDVEDALELLDSPSAEHAKRRQRSGHGETDRKAIPVGRQKQTRPGVHGGVSSRNLTAALLRGRQDLGADQPNNATGQPSSKPTHWLGRSASRPHRAVQFVVHRASAEEEWQ